MEMEPSIKHLVSGVARSLTQLLFLYYLTIIFCLLQVVSGGVASNLYVRNRLYRVVSRKNLQLVCPPPALCTDNGMPHPWCSCLLDEWWVLLNLDRHTQWCTNQYILCKWPETETQKLNSITWDDQNCAHFTLVDYH